MKQILQMLPLILFLSFIGLVVYYLSNRLAFGFQVSAKPFYWIIGLTIILFMATIMTVMQTNATSLSSQILYRIAAIGGGMIFLMLLVTLFLDTVNLVVDFSPVRYGFLLLLLTPMLISFSLWNARNTKVIRQEVLLKNLAQEIKLVQWSDVHIGHFWSHKTLERLVKQTKDLSPDALVITGDLFDGQVELNDTILSPLRQLQIPIFFVSGNHDTYSGAVKIKQELRKNQVTVLENELVLFKGVQLIGLNYMLPDNASIDRMHHHQPGVMSGPTIESTLPLLGIDRDRPSILLHHNPIGAKYAHENGINLYLAGHTHAGQIFPVNLLNRFLFEYNRGMNFYKDLKVYVSQGSGTFGPPMRLGTDSEITLFTLKRDE